MAKKDERDPYKIEVGARLRRAIEAKGYKINRFAHTTLADSDDPPALKRAEDKLYKYVNGEVLVPVALVRRWRLLFGFTLEYIYDDDKSRLPQDLADKIIMSERDERAQQ